MHQYEYLAERVFCVFSAGCYELECVDHLGSIIIVDRSEYPASRSGKYP